MDKFEYQILSGRDQLDVPGGVVWYATTDLNESLGSDVAAVLNKLGADGWQMTGIGDIGFSKRTEIVLMRRA